MALHDTPEHTVWILAHADCVTAATAHAHSLYTAARDGLVRRWDVAASPTMVCEYRGHSAPVDCLTLTSDLAVLVR